MSPSTSSARRRPPRRPAQDRRAPRRIAARQRHQTLRPQPQHLVVRASQAGVERRQLPGRVSASLGRQPCVARPGVAGRPSPAPVSPAPACRADRRRHRPAPATRDALWLRRGRDAAAPFSSRRAAERQTTVPTTRPRTRRRRTSSRRHRAPPFYSPVPRRRISCRKGDRILAAPGHPSRSPRCARPSGTLRAKNGRRGDIVDQACAAGGAARARPPRD